MKEGGTPSPRKDLPCGERIFAFVTCLRGWTSNMATSSTQNTPVIDTTSQRFEIKYVISELLAEAIVDYIAPYITTDKHGGWRQSYVINSLYLDSSALALYWSSAVGEKNRFKLRIRSYTDKPEDPVFFEIKRRIDQVILKQRAITTRDTVERVLRGQIIPDTVFLKPSSQERTNLYAFRDHIEYLHATPKAMVRYEREAYVSSLEEPVRITFDRRLSALSCEHYDPTLWTYDSRWLTLDDIPVILEVKFTDRFPGWVTRMVQRFGLIRTSFAKYVTCVDALKHTGMRVAISNDLSEDTLWPAVQGGGVL